jgi:hypothetical protein
VPLLRRLTELAAEGLYRTANGRWAHLKVRSWVQVLASTRIFSEFLSFAHL